MRNYVYNKLLPLLFIVLGLSSCARSSDTSMIATADGACIQPLVKVGFPVNGREEISIPHSVLPRAPWQAVVSLPAPKSGDNKDTLRFSVIANNSVELWVTRSEIAGGVSKEVVSSLFVYKVQENAWEELPDALSQFTTEISDLYLANNGAIWAVSIRSASSISYPPQDQRNISLYDETSKTFQPFAFSEEIPPGWIVFDRDRNIFWIFEQGKAVYSADPKTREIRKRVDIPDLNIITPSSITISPDGNVYILNAYGVEMWTQSSVGILKFNTQSNTVEKIPHDLLVLDPVLSLFADQSSNLWLGDQAWLTPKNIWYKVVRSSIFVTHLPESPLSYQWDLPEIVKESSDGRLWFRSFNGTAYLDSSEGQWCWFTTYQSNIVEDQERNLWMIADNKLYKYSLESK